MGKAIKKESKEKEGREKERKAPEERKEPSKKKGIKGIIRIAGSDVFGEVPLQRALMKVKGIGPSVGAAISRVIFEKLSVPENIEVGDMSEAQLQEVDKIIYNIQNYVPNFLLNRRKDPEEGTDKHVITNDLIFANRQDIEREKKVYSWKGYRHSYGKKVRGQRTRNTGRKGRAVGVVRKTLEEAKKAALVAAGGGKKGAGAEAKTEVKTEAKEAKKTEEKK